MLAVSQQKGLAKCSLTGEFIGRDQILKSITRHSVSGTGGLAIMAEPGCGATELLHQAFDQIFFKERAAKPIYFRFRRDVEAAEIASEFVKSIITQWIAFSNADISLLRAGLTIDEALQLAPPEDSSLLLGLWRFHSPQGYARRDNSSGLSATEALMRAFDAPARAKGAGEELVLFLDDVHEIGRSFGNLVLGELLERMNDAGVRFVATGYRKLVYNVTHFKAIGASRLSFPHSAEAAAIIARRFGIELKDEVRDLVAEQLCGDLRLTEAFFLSAAERGVSLTDFYSTAKHYTDEIFDGRCAQVLDKRLNYAANNEAGLRATIGIVAKLAESRERSLSQESARKVFGLTEKQAETLFSRLNEIEFIRLNAGRILIPPTDSPQKDRLICRYKLEEVGENRALLFGNTVLQKIQEAPQRLARRYRTLHSLDLRGILEQFSRRNEVPEALLDYERFSAEYKGAPDNEIIRDLQRGSSFTLPAIVFAVAGEDIYPPIAKSLLRETCAVGFGIARASEGRQGEVWLAAEIDSKLEIGKETADFWCDRLEMAAVMSDLPNYRIWLVAREGFDRDAMVALRARGAIGSSRKQAELLRRFLNGEFDADGSEREDLPASGEHLEITLPMDENAELIAAGIVEELAKRHNFDARSINQIKTALIEAFINAAEHSFSPDGKIHQSFDVDDQKFTVTISNRGIRLVDVAGNANGGSRAKRRGWGMELMRRLMDEVRVEETDDGTRIRMTKFATPTR